MRTTHYLLTIGCLVLAASPLLAETDIGREMNRLQDEHVKAVAAATEPLKRRYQTALEQLLKRATQANELDTAVRIREQLTALEAAAVSPTTGKPHYTRETLPSFLTTTEWSWSAKPEPPDRPNPTRVTFTKDGQFLMMGKVTGSYKVIGAATLEVDNKVLKFADDYKSFEVLTWTDGTPRYGHRLK